MGDCLLDSFVGELEGEAAGSFVGLKIMLEVSNIGVALGGIVGLNVADSVGLFVLASAGDGVVGIKVGEEVQDVIEDGFMVATEICAVVVEVENVFGNEVGVVVDVATGVVSFVVVSAVEGFVDIKVETGGVNGIEDGAVITTAVTVGVIGINVKLEGVNGIGVGVVVSTETGVGTAILWSMSKSTKNTHNIATNAVSKGHATHE